MWWELKPSEFSSLSFPLPLWALGESCQPPHSRYSQTFKPGPLRRNSDKLQVTPQLSESPTDLMLLLQKSFSEKQLHVSADHAPRANARLPGLHPSLAHLHGPPAPHGLLRYALRHSLLQGSKGEVNRRHVETPHSCTPHTRVEMSIPRPPSASPSHQLRSPYHVTEALSNRPWLSVVQCGLHRWTIDGPAGPSLIPCCSRSGYGLILHPHTWACLQGLSILRQDDMLCAWLTALILKPSNLRHQACAIQAVEQRQKGTYFQGRTGYVICSCLQIITTIPVITHSL